jgi:hypothetical protein
MQVDDVMNDRMNDGRLIGRLAKIFESRTSAWNINSVNEKTCHAKLSVDPNDDENEKRSRREN